MLEHIAPFKRHLSWLIGVTVTVVCLTKVEAAANVPGDAGATNAAPVAAHPHDPALDAELLQVVHAYRVLETIGHGNADKVADLLARGANPNARDPGGNGEAAIIWALNFGMDDAAVLLLQHGADPNTTDSQGAPAAWYAAYLFCCPKALELMLKKGVDVTKADARGHTPLDGVTGGPHFYAGKRYTGEVWTDAEAKAWLERQRHCLDLLIAAGADLNGHKGTVTPLMNAIHCGNYEIAQALIDHGVDINLQDKDGDTALGYIFYWAGFHPLPVDLIETLLKHGSDPNQIISNGLIRLLTGAMNIVPAKDPKGQDVIPKDPAGQMEAIKLLLAYGADPNLKDANGETAVTYAQKHHPEFLPFLEATAKGAPKPPN